MRRSPRSLLVCGALAALVVPGCGLGVLDDAPGGADNLPTSGAGPYGKPDLDFDTPADEPYVVAERGAHLTDPSALARAGGGFRLWFARTEVGGEADTEIWYAELAAITELPDRGPEPALVPTEAWEQGRVTAPHVVELDEDGTLVMFYEGGADAPALGRADSTDGGATWHKHPANPLLTGVTDPSVARLDGVFALYYVEPGARVVGRAISTDGLAWSPDAAPVLEPRPGVPEVFDPHSVGAPFALATRTATGRLHVGLWYEGVEGTRDSDDIAIGYAGSFDGAAFARFAGPDPVLAPGVPREHAPTVVLEATTATMFYDEERSGARRIGVATHP